MLSVLVIDDDRLIGEMVSDILTSKVCTVLKTTSSGEGLSILEREDVDVVLLDLVMPGLSGLDLISEINENFKYSTVIVITAHASMDSAIEALRKGAYDYIKKPLKPEHLFHSVTRAAERSRLVRENSDLIKGLRSRVEGLELCKDVSTAISSTLDLDRLLEKIMMLARDVLGAEGCSILLEDKQSGEFVFRTAIGEKSEVLRNFRMEEGKGIVGWVFENAKPLLVSDVSKDERFCGDIDNKTGFETKSIMAIPLIIQGGVIGVVEVVNKVDGEMFDDRDMSVMITMAGQIAIATENARIAGELKKYAGEIEKYSKNLESMVTERTEELVEANRELELAHDQLLQSEKLSSLGQLSAGIAHEINNPIGFISSNIHALDKYTVKLFDLIEGYEKVVKKVKGPGKSRSMEMLDEVKKRVRPDLIKTDLKDLVEESMEGTERIKKIVKDLKDFARSDEGERRVADLNTLIDSTLNIVWNEVKYKAEVKKDYAKLPGVECMPVQLEEVFMNLLINAAQAIDKRGVISIKTFVDGERVVAEVTDTGSGISQKNIKKIFDPFFTTKEPGKGTGLGLSVSYNIVKRHGGDIDVKSIEGEGTTFTVSIPLKISPAEVKTHA